MRRRYYAIIDWLLLGFSIGIMVVGLAMLGVAVALYDSPRYVILEGVTIVALALIGLTLWYRETH